MGKHLKQALPSVYTLQCLTGKVDNNNNNNDCCIRVYLNLFLLMYSLVNSISSYIPRGEYIYIEEDHTG